MPTRSLATAALALCGALTFSGTATGAPASGGMKGGDTAGRHATHHPAADHGSRRTPHPAHHGHHPTRHAIRTYVNLGDSYSAGTGLEPLAASAPAVCRQAATNHAHDLAASLGYRLTDVSCSGADTSDFTTAQHPGVAPQLQALSKHTDLVTMMIGGNDSSVFSNALTACNQLGYSTGGAGSPCKDAYGTSFEQTVTTRTYPSLVAAFTAVRAKAPHARIAVIGYPRLMPTSGSCFPQMLVASGDVAYVNSLQTTLNGAIRRAAHATGVTYVDAFTPSTGHDACQPVGTRWVEPVVGAVTKERAHPNALGEAQIAALTKRALHLR